MSELVDWAAPERNKEPILEVLRRVLPPRGKVLEVASATGQHIAHFADALRGHIWQPSDYSDEHLQNLEARRKHVQLANLLAPIRLDVTQLPWPIEDVDAVYNANMIHISPWRTTLGLFAGAAAILAPGAPLVTYGPYVIDGQHTSESNVAFDESLRKKNLEWGVREVNEVAQVAAEQGFGLEQRVAMPANNFTLIWRRH